MPIFEINPVQRKALEALEWLYSNDEKNRRTGRSTVLALSYLRRLLLMSLREPGKATIHVEDHYDTFKRDSALAHLVATLAGRIGCDVEYDGRCNISLSPHTRITQAMLDAVTFTPPETKGNSRTLWEYLKDED